MNLFEINPINLKKEQREEIVKLHKQLHLISKNVRSGDKNIFNVCNKLLIMHTLVAKEMSNRDIDHDIKETLFKAASIDSTYTPPTMTDVADFSFQESLTMDDDKLKKVHENLHYLFWDASLEDKETIISLHDIAAREMISRGIEHEKCSALAMPEQQLKAGTEVECGACGNVFDYGAEPEISMGAVKCPKCGATINQMGEELKAKVKEELQYISKPYPNEHSARINAPGKYIRIRRKNDYFKSGIDAIFGITKDEKTEVQAIRFDKDKFTVTKAKAWLKKNDFDYISFEAAKEEKKKVETKCSIFKVDKKKQIVYGVVMEPDEVDTDGEWQNAAEIEKAYYKFMDNPDTHFDIQHQETLTVDKNVRVVEIYLAPADFTIEKTGEKIKKGSWVMALKILNDSLWQLVEKGELSGFSIEGYGYSKC